MSARTPRPSHRDSSDAAIVLSWQQRLRRGEPWACVETEVLTRTGSCPEAVLSLIRTAQDMFGDSLGPAAA